MWTPVEPAGTALIIRARSSMGPRTHGRPEPAMSIARSAAEVLRDHVVLELEAIDRMYLNVYVPHLQTVGAVVGYLRVHRGQRFASTTAVAPMSEAFVGNIEDFVNNEGIDLVTFEKWQRKDDVTQKYLRVWRPDGRGSGQFAESALDTLYVARNRGRIDIVAF